jgi:hypothetical protein
MNPPKVLHTQVLSSDMWLLQIQKTITSEYPDMFVCSQNSKKQMWMVSGKTVTLVIILVAITL